jgi:hypothetical protein
MIVVVRKHRYLFELLIILIGSPDDNIAWIKRRIIGACQDGLPLLP